LLKWKTLNIQCGIYPKVEVLPGEITFFRQVYNEVELDKNEAETE
jgi:hypothetical protein